MSTDSEKKELLDEFQQYLESTQSPAVLASQTPDLHSLLAELTGLKGEVKAEARQFKNTLDSLNSALAIVEADNKTLATELAASAERFEQQKIEMQRHMLLEMIEIYDRLSLGNELLHNYQPVDTLFKKSRKKDVQFIKRFEEGQSMAIKRFEQVLKNHQVRAIDCVGELLDPLTMSAVETAQDKQIANGMVLEELRKGFLFQDQVLRLAEVKVNKIR